jgi:hypothetical protein
MGDCQDAFFSSYVIPNRVPHNWSTAFNATEFVVLPKLSEHKLEILNERRTDEYIEHVLGEIRFNDHDILLGISLRDSDLVLTVYWSENEVFNMQAKQVLSSNILR